MKHPIARYNRNNPRGMAALLLGLCLTTTALAGDKPNPGQSSAFGKSLAQWQDTYFRWFVGQLSIPPDRNGNADVGHVVLMPLPSVPGGTHARPRQTSECGRASPRAHGRMVAGGALLLARLHP